MGSGWSGIGLGLVSSGIGAFGAYRQAQASNEAAEYNASQQQMMADNVRTRGQFDMTLLRLRNKQNLSALTQDVSNGGVDLSSPSAVRMLSAQRGMDGGSLCARSLN